MVDPDPAREIDDLVAFLKARVAERQANGQYPRDLDERLDEHFRRLSGYRDTPDLPQLEASIAGIKDLPGLSTSRIPAASHVPGGDVLHKAVARVVARQIEGVLQQVQTSIDALQAAVLQIAGFLSEPSTHVHAELLGQLDAVLERLSTYERSPADSVGDLADLYRRVEELELVEANRQFHPWFDYEVFEASFRGSRSEILERYRDLALLLKSDSPVLDIGCGRGEFLELLEELGVDCRGVDIDPTLVATAIERGFRVSQADAIAALTGTEDQALGGLCLIQVVEHMSQQDVADLAHLAADKVRPGGHVVIETVNPQSLYVYAHSFYLDPTHVRPVHPAYLTFLFQEAGFTEVKVEWRSLPPREDMIAPTSDSTFDSENAERINQLLFAAQDYAIIATR